MAKKKVARRVPQTGSPRMYGDGRPSVSAQVEGQKTVTLRPSAAATGAANGPRTVANLAREYSYVLGDLKRLGVIASVLFAVLVLLGIVVR